MISDQEDDIELVQKPFCSELLLGPPRKRLGPGLAETLQTLQRACDEQRLAEPVASHRLQGQLPRGQVVAGLARSDRASRASYIQ